MLQISSFLSYSFRYHKARPLSCFSINPFPKAPIHFLFQNIFILSKKLITDKSPKYKYIFEETTSRDFFTRITPREKKNYVAQSEKAVVGRIFLASHSSTSQPIATQARASKRFSHRPSKSITSITAVSRRHHGR